MHTRLLALSLLLLVVYAVHLDGSTAQSAHKHYRHLVSSHFDASGWDEIICVQMDYWTFGQELEYQYTSTYTQLIFDVLSRPNEGWDRRPDSRIKLYGIYDYGRNRWLSCKELDPSYRANHVDVEVFIKWNVYQLLCPYTQSYQELFTAPACAEPHPSYRLTGAHPPATNLEDWGKFGISFRSDRLDAGQYGVQSVYELINHEFGHVWGLADPVLGCPNDGGYYDPYVLPGSEGSVMHGKTYYCGGPQPWHPTDLDLNSVAGQMAPPPSLDFSAPWLGFPTATPVPNQPPPPTRTPTRTPTPTPTPTWTPTPKPVADLWLSMAPRGGTGQTSAPAGSWLVYDIRVRNIGPATATNVVVVAALPIGLEYVSHETYFAPGFTCNYVAFDRTFVCQAGSLVAAAQYYWIQVKLMLTLRQEHALTATVQSNPTTADPAANNLATFTLTGAPMDCTVRPKINVATAPNGDGRLRATVSIDNPSGTLDRLERLAFSGFTNAVVDIGGATLSTGNQVHTLGLNQDSATFYLRRVNPGPATVGLHVMDHCASAWETFVGGGANAF